MGKGEESIGCSSETMKILKRVKKYVGTTKEGEASDDTTVQLALRSYEDMQKLSDNSKNDLRAVADMNIKICSSDEGRKMWTSRAIDKELTCLESLRTLLAPKGDKLEQR